MSELIKLRNHLLDVLSAAQSKFREKCEYPEWIQKEHEEMLTEVNIQLATRCRKPITLEDLVKIEQNALGHSDYSSKFSLYLAEVILGTYKGIP